MVTRQSDKLVVSEALIPKYKKELTFLLDAVTNQSKTIDEQSKTMEENEIKMDKYSKEMGFLHEILLSLNSKSTV